ncbi:MAG: hypothetical protein AB8B55_16050 [Mariniblastus sp.]
MTKQIAKGSGITLKILVLENTGAFAGTSARIQNLKFQPIPTFKQAIVLVCIFTSILIGKKVPKKPVNCPTADRLESIDGFSFEAVALAF